MLVTVTPNAHEARCDECQKVSPSMRGAPEVAREALVKLGWYFDRTGSTYCTICMRKITKRGAKYAGP